MDGFKMLKLEAEWSLKGSLAKRQSFFEDIMMNLVCDTEINFWFGWSNCGGNTCTEFNFRDLWSN